MASVNQSDKAKRSLVINIRVEPNQLNLIDAAASVCGKSRSAFMLDSAYRAAEEALLDWRLFRLNDEQWEAFNQALDMPPEKNEKLHQLLQVKSPWE
ncbi:type II toxin-antitoxin system TacA family antitoxin [Coleofasciculus sp.]|jgi:uncharacterized protein (DUF1778 family)|uniref:type II toxin-antitoxin system TacA family antitoxin n=1 Tax=Coleofasciculus sp. TaxID=3100458 RepID=UPI003A165171